MNVFYTFSVSQLTVGLTSFSFYQRATFYSYSDLNVFQSTITLLVISLKFVTCIFLTKCEFIHIFSPEQDKLLIDFSLPFEKLIPKFQCIFSRMLIITVFKCTQNYCYYPVIIIFFGWSECPIDLLFHCILPQSLNSFLLSTLFIIFPYVSHGSTFSFNRSSSIKMSGKLHISLFLNYFSLINLFDIKGYFQFPLRTLRLLLNGVCHLLLFIFSLLSIYNFYLFPQYTSVLNQCVSMLSLK